MAENWADRRVVAGNPRVVRSVELDVDIGADAIDYKYASRSM